MPNDQPEHQRDRNPDADEAAAVAHQDPPTRSGKSNRQTAPSSSKLRRWCFRLTALIVFPAVFLGLLEVSLRLLGSGYPTNFFLADEARGAFVPNPQFGWRFFPPAIARLPSVFSMPADKPEGTCRIFVMGGSAAMGDPEPSFAFSRILEVMLRERFPGARFEVINTGMVAINSHVVLPIARDCAEMNPDLFIVYVGNNEVVGPYGAGTVFEGFSSRLWLVRAQLSLAETRTGQLAQSWMAGLAGDREAVQVWRGMEFFLDHQIAKDDDRLQQVYAHFGENLADIRRAAERTGAGMILCTLGVNLKDCAPFASVHRPDLQPERLSEWNSHYQTGVSHETVGGFTSALEHYQKAAEIDDRFADLHFRMGRCNLALEQFDRARDHMIRARDLDALRFRADARINQVIRDVARASGDAVRLVDVERLFTEAAQAPGHIPGGDLFYDHCHMNINGNYRIARAILEEMEPLLPASIRQTSSSDRTIPDLRQCAKRLAFSGWDQLKINRDVLTAMERPPFTHRLDNAERIDLQRRQIATQQAFLTPEALQRYRAPYEQAIEQAPDDCTLRRNFASLLQALRDPSAAETQWRIVLNRFPEDAQAHIELGRSLVNQNKPKDGAEQYRLALASPYCDSRSRAIAHFNLAIALERLEQPADAIEHYRAAIRLSPTYEKAHVNLGLALRRQGEIDRALDHFKRAIEINPDFSPGHLNLALTLLGRERLEEAVSAFAEVSRIEPRNAMVHAAMGDTLVRLDRVDEAIAHFETVIQLAPGSAEAHHNLGIARMKQGDLSGAIEHFETALRLKPDFPDARANLEAARGKRELETRD